MIKARGGFICLSGGNINVLGRYETEKILVLCDGHIKREVQGIERGELAHVNLTGKYRIWY